MTKDKWITELGLNEHPEGGYFRETYRSAETIEMPSLGKRSLSTGIYFLIERGNFSAFHRIKFDEMWHYYSGDSLVVHMIDPEGKYSNQVIGLDVTKGEMPQFVVPAGVWFASEVTDGGEFSLVGCTVSFGFDFNDFELADSSFIKQFPQHCDIIKRLVR